MPHKQGLVPASVFLPDLPERSTDPGHPSLRRNRRTFTLADQVNQLVRPAKQPRIVGFLGRTMALCAACREATPATSISISA